MPTPFQVMMLRPSLDDFPHYAVPQPYTLRWYHAGDEQHWLAMKARSDQFHHADLGYYRSTYAPIWTCCPNGRRFCATA
jgi:hypothetical protein